MLRGGGRPPLRGEKQKAADANGAGVTVGRRVGAGWDAGVERWKPPERVQMEPTESAVVAEAGWQDRSAQPSCMSIRPIRLAGVQKGRHLVQAFEPSTY